MSSNYSSIADDNSFYYYYSHSIKRLLNEEVVVQQSSDDEFVLTSSSQNQNEWVPRIGGIITFLCSFCMLVRAWKRRSGLFHRLVLGMSLHLLVKSISSIVGMTAIPKSENDLDDALSENENNVGTITTCTIQGFFIYVCSTTSLFYYCSFSIYSFIGILNNFDKNKISWIEKYIHVLVHIYPIGSALYILSQQSFNAVSYGFCFIGSAPNGCIHHDDDVPCERGPQSVNGLRQMGLFWSIPLILDLVIPTTVMTLLYYMIRKRQEKICIKAMAYVKQVVIYLFVLYWTVLPFLVVAALHWTVPDKQDKFFHFFAFAHINFSLFALWAMLSYFFFSVEKKTVVSSSAATNSTTCNDNNSTTNIIINTSAAAENTIMNASTTAEHNKRSNDFVFSSQENNIEEKPSPTTAIIITPPPQQQQKQQQKQQQQQQQQEQRKYSFNIFDGTNGSTRSAFAEFVHAGDSEDESYDNGISEHWAAIQDHV